MRRAFAAIAALALIAAACTSNADPTTTTTAAALPEIITTTAATTTTTATTNPTTTSPTTSTTTPAEPPAPTGDFGGTLDEVPLIAEGTYPGPEWPGSLDAVAFADAVPASLHERLLRDGFVIEANTDDYAYPESLSWSSQFSSIYEDLSPYGGRAVFVTTDAGYHLWHQVFDKVLRDTETNALLPVLERLITRLVDAARTQAAGAAATGVEDAATRAMEHLKAVATVLELDVGPIGDRAAAEVALVEEHSQLVASPTVGGKCPIACVDYSLMTPRGHYTRTAELTRYFKAMSMLGNTMYLVDDPHLLRVGILVSRLITNDPQNLADWATIYDPTAFLVGTADDYTPVEVAAATETILAPMSVADDVALADDATMTAIGLELLSMRPVRIDPGLASARTMGARFVLDSWIYDQLTDPGVVDRIRPTPLDLVSAMGSDYAAEIQAEAGENATYPDYGPSVDELRDLTASRTIDDWSRTVYDGWLYALQPLWTDQHPDAFPPFMRTSAWRAKSHNTGFASYTELKHDTILYAKQGIAEGDAPEPPPPPRHWVEPDPVSFSRLTAVARMMRDGLVDAGLMLAGDYDTEEGNPWDEDETTRWATERLIEILDRLASIARDELDGVAIAPDDNEWLSSIGGQFSWLVDVLNLGEIEPTPLIADIFLDPFADEVLEIATGPLDTIHVLVPDDEGRFEIATGSVYSYYEFWGPRSERLSDEEWWDRIVADDLPDRPSWWTEELG